MTQLEGYLYKRASNSIPFQWNKRYFVLNESGFYYRSKKKNAPACEEVLPFIQMIDDMRLCSVRSSQDNCVFEVMLCPNNEFGFLNDRFVTILKASSVVEKERWISTFQQLILTCIANGDEREISPKLNGSPTSVAIPVRNCPSSFSPKTPSPSSSMKKKNITRFEISPTNVVLPLPSNSDSEDEDAFQNADEANFVEPTLQQRILESNPFCAECGSSEPDWLSLNLGIVLCISCGGLHRGLGVHVSKVRSMKFDNISDGELRMVLALGNDVVNKIWEGKSNDVSFAKPTRNNDRTLIMKWIKQKYVEKCFLEKDSIDEDPEREEILSSALYAACKCGDIVTVSRMIAKGANVNWKNSHDNGQTPLHAVAKSQKPNKPNDKFGTIYLPIDDDESAEGGFVNIDKKAPKWDGPECAELLLQNGALLEAVDGDGFSCLDLAIMSDEASTEMVHYFSRKAMDT